MKPFEYQELASRTEKPLHTQERLQHALLGITSEAGEIADTIKKHVIYGQALDLDNVAEEIGDIMWYIALLANATGLDLGNCMSLNIAKLKVRYPNRYTDQHAAARADKQGE